MRRNGGERSRVAAWVEASSGKNFNALSASKEDEAQGGRNLMRNAKTVE